MMFKMNLQIIVIRAVLIIRKQLVSIHAVNRRQYGLIAIKMFKFRYTY